MVLVASVASLALGVSGGPARADVQLGLDVSHWNGTIDWIQTSSGGYQFAFGKATEGRTLVDPTYPINRSAAVTFGLRFGAYHFARPGGSGQAGIVANAIAQADHFVDFAQPQPGDLPPVLDLETTGGLKVASLTSWTQAWLDEVQARTGLRALIYSSPHFWDHQVGGTSAFAATGHRLWVAHWTKAVSPLVPAANWDGLGWTFWQWTNCASIPGIPRCVDADRYKGADLGPVLVPAPAAAPPAPTIAPTIIGSPRSGKLVAAAPGTWSGGTPFAFSYQWLTCDAAGAGCSPIAGATAETYSPDATDVGHALAVTVTATNSWGTMSASSAPTVAVAVSGPPGAAPPAPSSQLQISGTPQAGQALSVSVGTWSGSPTAFAYQWNRCDATGAGCTPIAGATQTGYTVTPGDIGATLSVAVTATGTGGSSIATSMPTGTVSPAPLPETAVGSSVAQPGAAGAVKTSDGAVTVTWQPGAVTAGATVSLAPAAASRLALSATGVTLGIAGSGVPLPWPVDVAYAAATSDAVPGVSSGGGRWSAIPLLASPSLPAGQPLGTYRDPQGLLHILTEQPGTFALFSAGRWGDPSRISQGRPVLRRRSGAKPLRGRLASPHPLIATRISVNSQVHLYASVVGPGHVKLVILGQRSRIGTWLHSRPAKTLQALQLTPGWIPVRLRLARPPRAHGTFRLVLRAVDPYGRRTTLVIPVRF